jgi:hypothetical protein
MAEITLNNAADLRAFRDRVNARNDFAGQTFILTSDINIENDNQWTPIGTYDNAPFNGTFDGNGKVIRGVKISGSNDQQGLFGWVGAMGTIKNLGVIDVTIKGNNNIGGLVGYNDGIIEKCSVSGNVIINGNDCVGGLVGGNDSNGRIENCHAWGNIGGNDYIGGLVGMSNGSTIESCYSSGTIRGTGYDAGGLTGRNRGIIKKCYATGNVTGKVSVGGLSGCTENIRSNGGIISNSCAIGNVTGETNVGGLVGDIYANRIENCYATGNVKGNNNVGGLAGSNSYGTITNCYAIGNVKGNNDIGGFVGMTEGFAFTGRIETVVQTIFSSYYDTQTSEQFDARKGEPRATEDMQKQNTYEGWDFVKVWVINSGINGGLPYLRGVDGGIMQTTSKPATATAQTGVTPPATPATSVTVKGSDDVSKNIPVTGVKNSRTFAVIIVNENYQRESKVEFAKNDGETFKKYCVHTLGLPENNVHFMPDATLNNIRAEINWIGKIAEAFEGTASIIFYYAGHGVPDESSKSAYLLPVDGLGSDVTTGYKLDDLYQVLGKMPAKNITVFMDACFSGSQRSGEMLASARGIAINVTPGMPTGNMVVFSAAQGDETAFPYREQEHGMFTYFLLKKLQETKGDVTLGELGDYIRTNVRQQSIVINNKSQTPTVTPSATLGDKWKEMKLK